MFKDVQSTETKMTPRDQLFAKSMNAARSIEEI